MDALLRAWAMLQQRAQELGPERLVLIAVAATLVAVILLVSRLIAWLRTVRLRRRYREEVDALRQQLAEAQARYEREVRWRQASERVDATRAPATPAAPVPPTRTSLQAPLPESGPPQAGRPTPPSEVEPS